jgi:hypothetical protein
MKYSRTTLFINNRHAIAIGRSNMMFITLDLLYVTTLAYVLGEDSLVLSPLLSIAIARAFLFLFVWLAGAHLVDAFTTVLSSEARPKKLSE